MVIRPVIGLALVMRPRAMLGVLGLCLAAGHMALAADEEMYGPTTRDDTLWSIAMEVRPPGLTLAETIAALQRMNPQAFVDGDANLLMRGVMLKVPTTAAAMETSTSAEEPEPDPPAEESPAPEQVEIFLQETVSPVTATGDEEHELLAMRNAELEERLEAVQGELADATTAVAALKSQVSTLRRRLAESEAQAAGQSPPAKRSEATRRNAVTGIALALLVVVVMAFLYARRRWGSRAVTEPAAAPPLGARRIAAGRFAPETVPDEYAPATKLNLARAFVDMGRTEQAREVLEEVLAEGSEDERREADELFRRME